MINPYQNTKRAADTLGLIGETRLQFRMSWDFGKRDEQGMTPRTREWRTVGGSVGWREALLDNANRFLDAGLIDYVRPAGTGVDEIDSRAQVCDWSPVFLTRAGECLLRLWCREPFVVVPTEDIPDRIERAADELSAAYVEGSGLLEDAPGRYALDLRPHAECVAAELLDVENIGGVWR